MPSSSSQTSTDRQSPASFTQSLDIPRLVPCHAEPLTDPVQAIRAALAQPVGFPPLAQATVPGDTAAVALGAGLPALEQVAAGAVAALCDAGIEPRDITLVSTTDLTRNPALTELLREIGAPEVRVIVHTPTVPIDEDQVGDQVGDPATVAPCAMVGVMSNDQPLRLNRWIAEADVVLPIGVAYPASPTDIDRPTAPPKFAMLYPEFSDLTTQERLQKLGTKPEEGVTKTRGQAVQQLAAEQDEAGWLLGVLCTMQIVPATDDELSEVFAGEPRTVAEAAAIKSEAVWEVSTEESVDLVVAELGGGLRQQTWENLARAVSMAQRILRPGGAIAICTAISQRPTGVLRQLADADDLAVVERQLRKSQGTDADAARALLAALSSGPLFLKSDLQPSQVEPLGITAIGKPSELARLISSHDRCLVMEQAQLLVPSVETPMKR